MRLLPFYCLSVLVSATVFSQEVGTITMTDCFLEDCTFMEQRPQTRFGYLTIPENYKQPDGKKIQLAFTILKTPNKDFKGDPIIVFQGGWGLPMVDVTEGWHRFPLLQQRDVILFDYRGTGLSTQLPCETMGQQAWEDVKKDMPYSEFSNAITNRYRACLEMLAAQKIDVNQYGMKTIARDAAFLAQQLEYDTYNIFGISYGSMGMQHFLRAAKDYDIEVRAAIFDSNVPIGIATQGSMGFYYARVLNSVIEDCASNETCNEAYPNLKERFLSFLDTVDEKPLALTLSDGTKAYLNREEINSIIHQIIYSSRIYKDVPILLENFIDRNSQAIAPIAESMKDRVEKGFNAVGMVEYVQDYGGMVEESKANFDLAQQKYKQYSLVDMYYDFYVSDTIIAIDSVAITPVKTSVPSLLLAGTYDPITPPEWNINFRKRFSNHYYYEFPKIGHGIAVTPCGSKMITKFMDDPNTAPEVACLDQVKEQTINFRTSYYQNANISTLGMLLQDLQPLWMLIALVITLLVLLVNVILGLVEFIKKKSTATKTLRLFSSLLGLVFLAGLGYFLINTASSDSFLLAFGLPAAAKFLFYLVPLLLITIAVYFFTLFKNRSFSDWHIVSSLVFIFVFGFIVVYRLYPAFS